MPPPAATTPVVDVRGSAYRMPAEWEPHRATWLAWPHHAADWPGKFAAIAWVYAEIVRRLTQTETVCLLVGDEKIQQRARRVLRKAGVNLGRIEFYLVPTDRVWTRDYCPIFVVNPAGDVALTDWHFNGWAKYPNWQRDDAASRRVAELLDRPIRQPTVGNKRVVLEGGSIDVNGHGLLLTTEECLLSPVQARNPGLSQAQLESVLCETLGVQKVLWLNRGIVGDDTHGHVDDLARFVGERTVVVATEDDPEDDNFAAVKRESRTSAIHDGLGRPAIGSGAAAATGAGDVRGPTAAGQLRQFLRGQWSSLGADVQRSDGPNCARDSGRRVSRPRGNRHPFRGFGLGLGHAALPDSAGTVGSLTRLCDAATRVFEGSAIDHAPLEDSGRGVTAHRRKSRE